MIQDVALRWIVTLLFVFSAGVCLSAIAAHRHGAADGTGGDTAGVISHSLHAVMAVAMAVMAWPRGADLPSRAPMIFFLAAAVWFVVVTVRAAGHRVANGYHTLMMAAMAWMYAAMGGFPLRPAGGAAPEMTGMGSGMGMGGEMAAGSTGHAGHAGHAGHTAAATGMQPGADPAAWIGVVNWVCALGFAAAAVYWFYRFVAARISDRNDGRCVGILCQLAMAAGMAVMFGVML